VGTKVKIRRANVWDNVRIATLLKEGADEQAKSIWYSRPSKSDEIRVRYVIDVISRGLVIVGEAFEDGKPPELVGAIGMVFAKDGWSDDWVINNEWFYVHKDWRTEQVGQNLLTAVENFADTQKNPQNGEPVRLPIVLGVLSGTDAALKDEMMARRGWSFAGSNFVRPPTPIEPEPLDDGDALRGE
jgi:GNAT superfamily N-acetyltransferase